MLSENYYGIRDPGILIEKVFIPSLLVSKSSIEYTRVHLIVRVISLERSRELLGLADTAVGIYAEIGPAGRSGVKQ